MASLLPLPSPPVDEAVVSLALISDLTPMLPPDVAFDFAVAGAEVSTAESGARIGLLLDNSAFSVHSTTRCEVRGLSRGYHLLRAFLLLRQDSHGHLCVKSPVAYVEAEFFVEAPFVPDVRGFMFGQPSLCFLSPRDSLSVEALPRLTCDFFVHNCAVSDAAFGFSVKVLVNGAVVGVLKHWSAFTLTGLDKERGKLKIRLVLVNPAGEDVMYPPYNCEEHEIILTSE